MAVSGIASSKNGYFFAFSAAKPIFEKFRLQSSSSLVGGAMLASR